MYVSTTPSLSLSLPKEARIDKKVTTIIYKKSITISISISQIIYKINFLGINIKIFDDD